MEVFKQTKAKFGSRNAMALKRPVNGVVPSDWTYWTWYHILNLILLIINIILIIGIVTTTIAVNLLKL